MGRKIDFLIKEVLKEKYDNIICPPKEEIWEQLEPKLLRGRKKNIIQGFNVFSKIQAPLKLIPNCLSSRPEVFTMVSGRKSKSDNQ